MFSYLDDPRIHLFCKTIISIIKTYSSSCTKKLHNHNIYTASSSKDDYNVSNFLFEIPATIFTRYFTNDNEPDGTENATHNTFAKLTWIFGF
jgi:hypothetical protein